MEASHEKKTNILYVDDIPTNLILFEANFQNDFNVFLADSGEKALELLKQEVFAVIISDQRMPEMTGSELLEIVSKEYPNIIRFMLTAYTDYQTVVDSINRGQIYGFFNKPFDAKEMKIALNKAIEVYYLRERNAHMMQEIEKANRELRNIDKTKTVFLNAITNEIRSPINKIISVVHMLKDNNLSSDLAELVNYLDVSVSKIEKFSLLTNQLARLQEGNQSIEMKKVSLRELLEVSILEIKDTVNSSSIKINVGENCEGLKITGDFDLLLTCLTILLESSFSQMKKDEILNIVCNEEGNSIFMEINYPLNSISENQLNNLILHFSDDSTFVNYNIGIELILVKQIIMTHHGKIKLSITGENMVVFELILPVDHY